MKRLFYIAARSDAAGSAGVAVVRAVEIEPPLEKTMDAYHVDRRGLALECVSDPAGTEAVPVVVADPADDVLGLVGHLEKPAQMPLRVTRQTSRMAISSPSSERCSNRS